MSIFISNGEGYIVYPEDNEKIKNNIELGLYSLQELRGGAWRMDKIPLPSLLEIHEGDMGEILERIYEFSSKRDAYLLHKLKFKFNILMYGPPGTGKTSIALLAINKLVSEGKAIAFSLNESAPQALSKFLNTYLWPLPKDILKIVFIDEADKYVNDNWLSFLDGVDTPDSTIVILCTNYPEDIDERLWKGRPGRMDMLVRIDKLSDQFIKEYMKDIEVDENTRNEIIKEILVSHHKEKLTIDELTYIKNRYRIYRIKIKKAIQEVLGLRELDLDEIEENQTKPRQILQLENAIAEVIERTIERND